MNDHAREHFAATLRWLDALTALPAELLTHEYTHEAFGSWCSVVRHHGVVFRVSFDGRDGVFAVERSSSRKPPHEWSVLWRQPLDAVGESGWASTIAGVVAAAGRAG